MLFGPVSGENSGADHTEVHAAHFHEAGFAQRGCEIPESFSAGPGTGESETSDLAVRHEVLVDGAILAEDALSKADVDPHVIGGLQGDLGQDGSQLGIEPVSLGDRRTSGNHGRSPVASENGVETQTKVVRSENRNRSDTAAGAPGCGIRSSLSSVSSLVGVNSVDRSRAGGGLHPELSDHASQLHLAPRVGRIGRFPTVGSDDFVALLLCQLGALLEKVRAQLERWSAPICRPGSLDGRFDGSDIRKGDLSLIGLLCHGVGG